MYGNNHKPAVGAVLLHFRRGNLNGCITLSGSCVQVSCRQQMHQDGIFNLTQIKNPAASLMQQGLYQIVFI